MGAATAAQPLRRAAYKVAMMTWLGFGAAVVFWSNALLLIYIYWGYGVLLKVLGRLCAEVPMRRSFS